MIEIETLKTDILKLSPEAQKMVAEFVEFLKAKSQTNQTPPNPLNFDNQGFVGMWSDRPETEDSSQWVRNLRQNH
ncbi:hypothetical protein [Synechococcus sp. BDU 130192]|uniref:hypothetical protein n=1 Tax=Synechococcus sp. BDU 130192 TaxID=2042059 RepID=UPI000C083CE3|nr:hypothetical protein [Synechococcus sp. BDU 130192]